MKKISNDIAAILKNIIDTDISVYKHIALNSYYKISQQYYFIELTIIYENNSLGLLEERRSIDGNIVLLKYVSKISVQKNLKTYNDYLFTVFPHSIIIKDENRFLINLKSSLIFYIEKNKTIFRKSEIDSMRWLVSNYIEALKHHDSEYLRYKIYEGLIDLYNFFTPEEYISKYNLPILFANPQLHPYINDLVKDSLSTSDFELKMIEELKQYGGILKCIDPSASFYEDEIVIVFLYKDLNLDLFLENIFLRFSTITKNINYHIESFYWEKNTDGLYVLYLKAPNDLINKEILPELRIKMGSDMQVQNTSSISIVYNFLQEHYYSPLHSLADYILELKTTEYLEWNNNIAISYCIELYISCFIRLNFTREDFINFNRYISQKWQLLLLSDDELVLDEYFSIAEMYQKFEKLYVINEKSLLSNFAQKIDSWKFSDSFSEEILLLEKNMLIAIERPENSYICKVLSHDLNEYKYAFLEGFLFKSFGLFGMETESKVYITYIINRISNEN